MAFQFSDTVINAALDAMESFIGPSPVLEIRTGSAPAQPELADSGTLLASMVLPLDWMANASAGSKGIAGSWLDAEADAAGVAGHFRIKVGANCHMQGDITAAGLGGAMTLDTTSITVGRPVQIRTFTINTGAPQVLTPGVTYFATGVWPDTAAPGDVLDTLMGAPAGASITIHGLGAGAVTVDGTTVRAGPNYAAAMDVRMYFVHIVTTDPGSGEFSTVETYVEVYTNKTALHLPPTHFYQAADVAQLQAAIADIKARTLAEGADYPGCVVELTPGVEYDCLPFWFDVSSAGRRMVFRSGGPGRFSGPMARLNMVGLWATRNIHFEYVELVSRCDIDRGLTVQNRRPLVSIRGANYFYGTARCRMIGGYRNALGKVDPSLLIDPYKTDYSEYSNIYIGISGGVVQRVTFQPCDITFQSADIGTNEVVLVGRHGYDVGGQQIYIGDNSPTGGDTDNTGWPATGGFEVINYGTATTPFRLRVKVEGGWATAFKVDDWGAGINTLGVVWTSTCRWTAVGHADGRRRDMSDTLASVFIDSGSFVDGVNLSSNTGRSRGQLCYSCDFHSVNLIWQSEPGGPEPFFIVGNRTYATYKDISSWVMDLPMDNRKDPHHFAYNFFGPAFSSPGDKSQPHADTGQRRVNNLGQVFKEKFIGNAYHQARARGIGLQGKIIEAYSGSWMELEDVGNFHLGGNKNIHGTSWVRNSLLAYGLGLMDRGRPGPTADIGAYGKIINGQGSYVVFNSVGNNRPSGASEGASGGLNKVINSDALSASLPYEPYFADPMMNPIDTFEKMHAAFRPIAPSMMDRGPAASKTMVMDHEHRAWRVESVPMIVPFGMVTDVEPGSRVESGLRHMWRGRLTHRFEPLDGLEWRRDPMDANIGAQAWRTLPGDADLYDAIQVAGYAPPDPVSKRVYRYRVDGHEETFTIFTADLLPATRVRFPGVVLDGGGAVISNASYSQSSNAASVSVPSTDGGGVKKLIFHLRFRTPSTFGPTNPTCGILSGASSGGIRWTMDMDGFWSIRFGSASNTPVITGGFGDPLIPGKVYSLLIQIDNTVVSPVIDADSLEILAALNPLAVKAAVNGREAPISTAHTGNGTTWDTTDGTRNQSIPFGLNPVLFSDPAKATRLNGWEMFDLWIHWGGAAFEMGDAHDYENWGRRFTRLMIGENGEGPIGMVPKIFLVFDSGEANAAGIVNRGTHAMAPFVRATSATDTPYI